MRHQIKHTGLYSLGSPKTITVLNPSVNGKIQGLFKAFECLSSTFQGKFNFQGLFKTFLYIQVLFKHVCEPCVFRHVTDCATWPGPCSCEFSMNLGT